MPMKWSARYALGISEPVHIKCYDTVIESLLRYRLLNVYGHLSKDRLDKLSKVCIKPAKDNA